MDWVGDVYVRCPQTGLVAELTYMTQSFFGFRGRRRLIKGKIFHSDSMNILYKIDGHWDRYLSHALIYNMFLLAFAVTKSWFPLEHN
jgi:hypothetical protein